MSRWRQGNAGDVAWTGVVALAACWLALRTRRILSCFGTASPCVNCVLLVFFIWAVLPLRADQIEWFTDIEAAQAKARNENKILLLNFTGSDWSPWCRTLKSEVFDRPEFADYANSRMVAAEVDFPHEKSQTDGQKQVNQKLAQILEIKTVPTVVLIDPSGRPMGQTGYMAGGPTPFIQALEKIITGRQQATPSGAQEQPDPPRKPAVFVPIAPAAALRYHQLALKAISGPKNHRMALINNENFYAGDSAKVKVLDDRVEVFCKEVREDSVLITANGKPMELKLGQADHKK